MKIYNIVTNIRNVYHSSLFPLAFTIAANPPAVGVRDRRALQDDLTVSLSKKRIELLQWVVFVYGEPSVRIENSQADGVILYGKFMMVSIKYTPE